MSIETATPPTSTEQSDAPDDTLFRDVLDMARAAKTGNTSGWLAARYRGASVEDLAYLASAMLGVLVENDAIRRGIHPADAWQDVAGRGLADFG